MLFIHFNGKEEVHARQLMHSPWYTLVIRLSLVSRWQGREEDYILRNEYVTFRMWVEGEEGPV